MQTLFMLYIGIFLLSSPSHALERSTIRKLTMNNHQALEYKEVKLILFSTVDNNHGIVCSVYTPTQCQDRYYKPPKNKSREYFKLNIEHTWPQSKGAKELPANSDMHHLFVTSKESNSKRANLPFCNAEYDYWQMDGSIQGFDEYSQDCFEPQDNHKGNVARAMFYFSIRYERSIDMYQEQVLREWNELDPVDQREVSRNKLIKKIQGNSNPFITNLKLVHLIKDF
mgnify:CR=1 FL=1